MAKRKAPPDDAGSDIYSYLTQLSELSPTNPARRFYKLFLDKGKSFSGRLSSEQYPPHVATWKRRHRPQPKSCFHNAQMLAIDFDGAAYYEGFVLTELVPLSHAWNVTPDGKVIDLTLEAAHELLVRLGLRPEDKPPPRPVYLGIEIPKVFVAEHIARHRETAPLVAAFYNSAVSRRGRGSG